jgi:AcrR family transcriptional regulator
VAGLHAKIQHQVVNLALILNCIYSARIKMKPKGKVNLEKIVQSANDLFYRNGYNQTSFSEIAQASGLPRGNFYYYFKSKDDILRAVVDARLRDLTQMFERWATEHTDPKERLLCLVEMVAGEADEVERYGCPLGTLALELGKNQQDLKEKTVQMFDLFVNWIEDCLLRLDIDDARFLAMQMMGRVQGVTVMTQVYQDKEFFLRETELMKAWVNSL